MKVREMFGVLGVLFLFLAYVVFIFSYVGFLVVDIIGTLFLLLHAIKIRDKTFIIVNSWILLVLFYKLFQYIFMVG